MGNQCIFGAFLGEGLKMQAPYEDYESFLFRYPRSAGPWHAEIFTSVTKECEGAQDEVRLDHFDMGEELPRKAAAIACKLVRKGKEQVLDVRQSKASIFCDPEGIIVGID